MPRMSIFLLHLETSTKICSVALSKDGAVVDFIDRIGDGFIHGESLTLMIEEVLEKCQIPLSALSGISYSAGPGSYTGLRIGLSTAKGLCFALQIPLIAIPTHQSLCQIGLLHASSQQQKIICMLDARRLEVYFEGFDTRGNVIEHLRCQIIDANSFNAFLPCLVVGDANEKIAALTEDPRVSFIDEKLSAKYQATLAYKKYQEQHFEDLAYCSPIYLKGANGVLL
jgi:tRNA threonylcarbamoyladenosine biosynthesis protein TsaB